MSLTVCVYMNKHAVLLAVAARTTDVTELKRDLEQAQGELDLTRRHLEENKVSDSRSYAFKDRQNW